jgi:Holliday junction resolvasome RuvABC endonuclease subunit
MNTTVIGVDPSSMKHVAVTLRDGSYEISVFITKAKDMPTRCLEAFRWMRKVVRNEDGPVDLFLELPMNAAARGGVKALLPLAQIQGALAAGALSGGATVHQVYVQSWKKTVVGNGNASKLKIKIYLRKNWPSFYLESEGDIDVCDAGAIAIHGRKQVVRWGGMRGTRLGRIPRARSVLLPDVGNSSRTNMAPLVKSSTRKLPTR